MSGSLQAPSVVEVSISAATISRIREHASETYPHECCGALIEKDGTIVDAFPLPNTAEEGAARRFRVGPDDYRRSEARATVIGGTLSGFYHSHPDAPARPSAYDLEHAWPNWSYVIISVTQEGPGDVTVWRLRDDRSTFDRGELRWLRRS